ncbi:amidase [Geranomyces variabilis]|nr:amidase [Geranomyces variabilis]KAJ3140962.1 hypothetical protein HDU90_006983 [Geranomyces variabilis]
MPHNPDPNGYNLHALVSPAASGWTLRLLAFIVEHLGSILGLSRKIARDSNLFSLRHRGFFDLPTYYPIVAPDAGQGTLANAADLAAKADALATAGLAVHGRIFRSVADFRDAYKEGRATPVDVAEAVITAITAGNESHSPPLLAVIKHNNEDLRLQAKESLARHKAGKPLSVLDGVPIAVKDELDVLGYETNVGTNFISLKPTKDAHPVALLRAAGALIIGKANMHEIGIDVTNANPWTGTPRNPYAPGRVTGGSSGGSAAAVAAGLCPIAIGADGGGSVRIPAAFCGIFGLKPTAGRVSETGAFPLAPTVGVVGPLAATAADMAVAYAVMAGPDPEDPNTMVQPPVVLPSGDKGVKGLKIGVYKPYFEDAEPAVVAVCRALLDELVTRGAVLVDITIPELEDMRVAHANIITSEMASAMSSFPTTSLSPASRLALNVTQSTLAPHDYITACRVRTRAIATLKALYANVDVIATPSTAIPAPKVFAGAKEWSDYTTSAKSMRYIVMANLCGVPAVTVPAGYTPVDKLPIGMQFQAKWWNESLLLSLAATCEAAQPGGRRRPGVLFDLLHGVGEKDRRASERTLAE